MAFSLFDRVVETSTTTGTGAFTLAAAVTGYRRFSSVYSVADTMPYVIEGKDTNGNPTGEWEVGTGTYSSANTLTRTSVEASSNANAAVNFSAGTKWVWVDASAAYLATAYRVSGTDVAVADGGTGSSTAAGARSNLGAATTSQTGEQISGFIASPSNKSYTIALDMKHAGTITEVTTKSASGTCTATWKINTTALGGTANSVSSSEQSQSHSSSNAFAAGDDIVLTVSSNSSCTDMSFTIKYTRTLA